MVSVVIVAGGKGVRMGSDIPKQFIKIGQYPILMQTIKLFHNHPQVSEVVVVLPLSQFEYWQNLCKEFDFVIPHKICQGGFTRFHSVKNGLEQVSKYSKYIMIHDGVRPFVSAQLIDRLIDGVKTQRAVVPVVDMIDSVRFVDVDGSTKHIERSKLKKVQTPQTFERDLICRAYSEEYQETFSDDASVVEALGEKISVVQGDVDNIKITNQIDIVVAEMLLKKFVY